MSIQLRPPGAPPAPGPKHDSLHMADGLRYCWCMCPRCFLKYGSGSGICTCRQCPCSEYWASMSPMAVPRRPSSGQW